MRVRFAHLCDYAMVSAEGKLSVLGIFSVMRASQLPYRHPQAFLAFEIELTAAEAGREFSIEIHCVDSDGNKLFEAKSRTAVGRKDGLAAKPGDRPRFHQVLRLNDLQFARPGMHNINIFLNGQASDPVEFELVYVPPAPPTLRPPPAPPQP